MRRDLDVRGLPWMIFMEVSVGRRGRLRGGGRVGGGGRAEKLRRVVADRR